ncbi:hypothetical protein GCM10009504_39810 [Pseudomonas laurentiana]|uniref:Lipoprotein n=1 Tax=Pseudomonas laurentiana TaxID=2364649 RepID=A0A6I5RMV5_9PSED|nr:hypothetical protein [Pseudomonas laurentiana]NES09297.1 hypothetical protein [Pseudomonas laurentiana]GGU78981.1 hypothetical protein GCM10009504_39810 [Pseudomonas laurentiana]
MRSAAVTLLAIMISGCATSPSDLARYGDVELESQNVKSLTVNRDGPVKSGSLPKCVAITIRNDSVTMTQSGGYAGSYTGNYYQASSSREVGGGSVAQYVAADGSEIVARGETRFTTSLVERSLRYTVNVNQTAGSRIYKFTGIEQAGTTNGYGYHKIAAMTGTGVETALASLGGVVDELESCMK